MTVINLQGRLQLFTSQHLPRLDMGTVPAWVGGIGTVLAVSIALFQIARDRILRRQEERRSQAQQVSAWIESAPAGLVPPAGTLVHLLNSSDEPVYEVVVSIVLVQGGGPGKSEDVGVEDIGRATIGLLPPGDWAVGAVPGFSGGMSMMPGVEVGFTDRAGRHWIRRASGTLKCIKKPMLDYLELRPLDHATPMRWP